MKKNYKIFLLGLFVMLSSLSYVACTDDNDSKKEQEQSSECSLSSFMIDENNAIIDNNSVSLSFDFGTDVSSLTPTIVVSEKATVSPKSGEAQDFTNPVEYTVTAEDGTTKKYIVKIKVNANTAAEIESFKVGEHKAIIENNTIKLDFDTWKDVTSLSPIIKLSANATVSPASGVEQDFTNPVIYTVTAEDGTTKEYTISVTTQEHSDIESLTINGVEATINGTNIVVEVEVDENNNIYALTPTIEVSAGATVSPASATEQNFLRPVTYTVTGPEGTVKEYKVSVVVPNILELAPNNKTLRIKSNLVDIVQIGTIATLNGKNYTVVDSWSLKDTLTHRDAENSWASRIVTTKVTSMNRLFYKIESFGDISSWDVSNVTDMGDLFKQSKNFNGDISAWDVSNVTNMYGMFYSCEDFNQDISSWNTSKVKTMGAMFRGASKFNQDISSWNTANVKSMSIMFAYARKFNQDISSWNTSKVTNMAGMFMGANAYDQDLSGMYVPNIPSKPDDFDAGAEFQNQTAKQPKWGQDAPN